MSQRIGELPPPHRYGHDTIKEDNRAVLDEQGKVTGYVKGVRVSTTCVLDRLRSRNQISRDLWKAGKRLYGDFHRAGLEPRVTLRLGDYVSGSNGHDMSDRQIEAKQAFDKAMIAVGPELNDLLFDVVCFDKTLGECEAMRRWRPTVGLAVLEIALKRLKEHYGKT